MSKFQVALFCVALYSSSSIFRNSVEGQEDSTPTTEPSTTTTTKAPDTPYIFVVDLDADFAHTSWGKPHYDHEMYFHYYTNLTEGLTEVAKEYLHKTGVDLGNLKGVEGVWAFFDGLHSSDPCYIRTTITTTTTRPRPTSPTTPTTIETNRTTTTSTTTTTAEPCWTKVFPEVSFSRNGEDAIILETVELRYFTHNSASIDITFRSGNSEILTKNTFEVCNDNTAKWNDCQVDVPSKTTEIDLKFEARDNQTILLDKIVIKTMGYELTTTVTSETTTTPTTTAQPETEDDFTTETITTTESQGSGSNRFLPNVGTIAVMGTVWHFLKFLVN